MPDRSSVARSASQNDLVIPLEIDGEVVVRRTGGGRVAVEGWVGSFDGHRCALDNARRAAGVRTVEDRVSIVLGRRPQR
jgi:hypothetical protein